MDLRHAVLLGAALGVALPATVVAQQKEARHISPAGEELRAGQVLNLQFDETYRLTPMDMSKRQANHPYAVLHSDPDLGWELGVYCGGGSHSKVGRYCSSVTFRVSQDLSVRPTTRGVDGVIAIDYTRGNLGTLEQVWPEVRLEGLNGTLTFQVESLNAIISRDTLTGDRLDPVVFGARMIEVRVRLSG